LLKIGFHPGTESISHSSRVAKHRCGSGASAAPDTRRRAQAARCLIEYIDGKIDSSPLLLESWQVVCYLSTYHVMISGVLMFHYRHKVQPGGFVTVTSWTGRVTLLDVHIEGTVGYATMPAPWPTPPAYSALHWTMIYLSLHVGIFCFPAVIVVRTEADANTYSWDTATAWRCLWELFARPLYTTQTTLSS
jgi:hypothetical protein